MLSTKSDQLRDEAALLKRQGLIEAISKADLEAAKQALSALTREDLCARDRAGCTALHRAAQYGNVAMVRLVLQKLDGATDLDVQDATGKTPLHYAILPNVEIEKKHKLNNEKRVEVFHLLQAYGASPSVLDHKKKHPEHLIQEVAQKKILGVRSARQYKAEKVLGLVDKIKLCSNQTLLHVAVVQGSVFGTRFILKEHAGIDINAQTTPGGHTALIHAAAAGSADIVDVLCEHPDLKCDLVNDDGITALHAAAQGGSLSCVNKMLEKGCPLQAKDKEGNTALFYAIQSGNKAIIERLLQADKTLVTMLNKMGDTPLHLAIAQDLSVEIIDVLLKAGADLYAVDHQKKSAVALSISLMGKGEKYLKHFFELPDFDWSATYHHKTLLWYAVYDKNLYAFNIVSKKAPQLLHAVDADGGSLVDLIDFLLKQRSLDNRRVFDELDKTGLILMRKSLEGQGVGSVKPYPLSLWVKFELSRLQEVDVHAVDENGRTLLHLAAFFGDTALCAALLKLGVDRNLKDHQGLTPLQYASKREEKEIVELLIKSPIVPLYVVPENPQSWVDYLRKMFDDLRETVVSQGIDLCDVKRRTFLHMASFFGYAELCRFLLENKADPNFQDDKGWSPLHYAALANQGLVIWELICSDKVEWVLPDSKGESPVKKLIAPEKNSDAARLLNRLSTLRMRALGDAQLLPALHMLFSMAANPRVNWDELEFLLKFPHINTTKVSTDGPLLFSAIRYFPKADFERLIQHPNIDINARDEGLTAVHAGCSRANTHGDTKGDAAVAAKEMTDKVLLLLARPDMEYHRPTDQGMTVLQAAVSFGAHEVVKYLIKEKKIYVSQAPQDVAQRQCALHDIAIYSVSLLKFVLKQLKAQLTPEALQEVLLETNSQQESILTVAAGYLNKESMQALIEEGVSYETRDAEGFYLMHFLVSMALKNAADLRHWEPADVLSIYQTLLEYFFALPFQDPGLNLKETLCGNTPLLIVVAHNNIRAVQALFRQKGLDLGVKNNNGYSVLDILEYDFVSPECRALVKKYQAAEEKVAQKVAQKAAHSPKLKVSPQAALPVPVVLSPKVKVVTVQEVLRTTPTVDTVQEALKHSDVNAKDATGETAVHLAIRHASHPVLKVMCEQKGQSVKLDIKNFDGDTPLHLAVRLNKRAAVQYLSQLPGQSFLTFNDAGYTPLNLAIHLGYLEIVKVLWPLTKTNPESFLQRLDLAVRADREDIITWLANKQTVNWTERNAQGDTFTQMAVKLGNLASVKVLHGLKAEFGVKDIEGNTLVHLVLMAQQYAVYEWLATKIGFLRSANKQGHLPLHIAALKGAPVAVMTSLIQGYTDALNSPDREGNTPLHLALIAGNIEAACQLLAVESLDLQVVNKKGVSYKTQIEALNNPVLTKAFEDKVAEELIQFNGAMDAENIPVLERTLKLLPAEKRLAAFEASVQNGKVKTYTYLMHVLTPVQRRQHWLHWLEQGLQRRDSVFIEQLLKQAAVDLGEALPAKLQGLLPLACQQDNPEVIAAGLVCGHAELPEIVRVALNRSITTGDATLFAWALSRPELDLTVSVTPGRSVIAYAIEKGYSQMALQLIAKATPAILAGELNALLLACERVGVYFEVVAALLKGNEHAINMQDCDGNTPLHLALRVGNFETARQLLAMETLDLQVVNNNGVTYKKQLTAWNDPALNKAFEDKVALDLTQFYAAMEAENISDVEHHMQRVSAEQRLSAFEASVQKGQVKLYTCLMNGLTPEQRQQHLLSWLEQGLQRQDAIFIQQILGVSCDVQDLSRVVLLVLERGIKTGDSALFAWALSHLELDLTTPLTTDLSAIAYAIKMGQPQMALQLIAKVSPEHLAGELKALFLACERREVAVMAALLDSKETDIKALLPVVFEQAVMGRDNDLLLWCVDQPEADLKPLLSDLLEYAIRIGDIQLLDWTLGDNTLDLKTVRIENICAVRYALMCEQTEVALHLMAKLDIETLGAKDDFGTLLHWACYYRNTTVIEALLPFVQKVGVPDSKGIDVNANNTHQATAYGFFIEQEQASLFPDLNQKFLELGAEVRFPRWNTETPAPSSELLLERPKSPAYLPSQSVTPPPPAQPEGMQIVQEDGYDGSYGL